MTKILSTTVAAGLALAVSTAGSAMAAPAADRSPTRVADATQIRPVAVGDEDDGANCVKPRKRLWIEGEGWVVRKVTICR